MAMENVYDLLDRVTERTKIRWPWIPFSGTCIGLDLCLWNMDAPGGNRVKIWQNLCLTFWPRPNLQGHGMSVKCEEPIDELTVQVWLLYHHPNLKYTCTSKHVGEKCGKLWLKDIALCKRDGIMDKRTDRRTIQTLDAPDGPFRPEA